MGDKPSDASPTGVDPVADGRQRANGGEVPPAGPDGAGKTSDDKAAEEETADEGKEKEPKTKEATGGDGEAVKDSDKDKSEAKDAEKDAEIDGSKQAGKDAKQAGKDAEEDAEDSKEAGKDTKEDGKTPKEDGTSPEEDGKSPKVDSQVDSKKDSKQTNKASSTENKPKSKDDSASGKANTTKDTSGSTTDEASHKPPGETSTETNKDSTSKPRAKPVHTPSPEASDSETDAAGVLSSLHLTMDDALGLLLASPSSTTTSSTKVDDVCDGITPPDSASGSGDEKTLPSVKIDLPTDNGSVDSLSTASPAASTTTSTASSTASSTTSSPAPMPAYNFSPEFTSQDARVVQHVYAIAKLELVLAHIDEMKRRSGAIVLLHYLTCCTPGVFYIADQALSQRVDYVSHYQLFKTSPPPAIPDKTFTHVVYDHQDTPVVPVDDLPPVAMSEKCVAAFEGLCKQVLAAYRRRLDLAKPDPAYVSVLRHLVGLTPSDFDTAPPAAYSYVLPDPALLADDTFSEALLIDLDIRAVLMGCLQWRRVLKRTAPVITSYKGLSDLKKPPPKALNEVIALTVRLNDMYTCVRRLGRQIYLSNYTHLTDQKFLFQSKNAPHIRSCMTKLDGLFNSNKRNGTLVAALTRVFMRHQTACFAANSKTCRDFANFLNQGWTAVDQAVTALQEFALAWVGAELKFRAAYGLPRKVLTEIYQEHVPPLRTANQKRMVGVGANAAVAGIVSGNPTAQARPSPPGSVRGSRSSSVSSQSSQSSLRKKSSPMRPLRKNDSSSSLSTMDSLKPAPSPPSRVRSNSSPGSSAFAATSGAAAALKQKSPVAARSPMGRTTVSPQPQRRSEPLTVSSKNVQKQLLAVAEESPRLTANQRLQQHLRQGAKQGDLVTQQRKAMVPVTFDPAHPSDTVIRRSNGTAETAPQPLHDPLAGSLPPGGLPPGQVTLPAGIIAPKEFTQPTFLGKPTPRDVQTRRNTARNSVLIDDASAPVSESSASPECSSTELSASSSVKKMVRFTGVPEYSEEEDMPTNYANRILKNFAVITRGPAQSAANAMRSHAAVRRKDFLLKKEESLQFRNQLHQQE
ncbi:hypothetical protein DICA3_F36884 [Diutina catenulata]